MFCGLLDKLRLTYSGILKLVNRAFLMPQFQNIIRRLSVSQRLEWLHIVQGIPERDRTAMEVALMEELRKDPQVQEWYART